MVSISKYMMEMIAKSVASAFLGAKSFGWRTSHPLDRCDRNHWF